MSAVSWSLRPDVNPPSVTNVGWEGDINELISPYVVVVSVDLLGLVLQVELRVAPSPSTGVTHVVPVDSEGSVSSGLEETVVVVTSGEELVSISPEPDSS